MDNIYLQVKNLLPLFPSSAFKLKTQTKESKCTVCTMNPTKVCVLSVCIEKHYIAAWDRKTCAHTHTDIGNIYFTSKVASDFVEWVKLFFFLVWYISNIARKDERGKEEWFYFLSITETACVNKFQFLSEKKN